MITEQFIAILWQKAPEWAICIAVDFDGFVFAFENQPYHNKQREQCWIRNRNATNQNRVHSLAFINAEFPNWTNPHRREPIIVFKKTPYNEIEVL